MLATSCDSILPLRRNLVADFSQSFSILIITALRGSLGHAVHQIFPFDLFLRLRRAGPRLKADLPVSSRSHPVLVVRVAIPARFSRCQRLYSSSSPRWHSRSY